MFVLIMIIIIVLTNFLTLVYAKERLEDSDIIVMTKNAGILIDYKMSKSAIKVLFRLILSLIIFIFWIYSLIFIPFLRLTIILNIIDIIISIITITKMYKNPNLFETFTKRLWITRVSAILSLVIWFPHFLPLLAMAF